MATFQARVEGLTGLSIGTSPTTAELTEFLKDGVLEVTNRILVLRPQDAQSFQRATTISDSQGVNVGGAQIISVLREANADGSSDGSTSWRECNLSTPALQSKLVDVNSLHYASKFNPAYIIQDNHTINVYPTPSSNNGIKVYYVNEEPRDVTNGASLAYNHSDIKYFPNDKVYLVVLYASLRSLENAMSAKNAPTVSGDATELTSVDDLDTDNLIDVHADQIELDQWWSTASHYIEDEEDVELAEAQLTKISAYINAYTAQLSGNQAEYEWMQARHKIISDLYDNAFIMMTPKVQKQQGAK
tara:strand:- start:1118 stop:2023 length:906 start_codon:yes stop_codon:yes gene_type:complete